MESLLQVGLVIVGGGGLPMIDGPIGQKGFCAAGVRQSTPSSIDLQC